MIDWRNMFVPAISYRGLIWHLLKILKYPDRQKKNDGFLILLELSSNYLKFREFCPKKDPLTAMEYKDPLQFTNRTDFPQCERQSFIIGDRRLDG